MNIRSPKYITLLILAAFASFISMAYTWTSRPLDRIGCTELNGDGCVCHNLERTEDVKVWVTGPEVLEEGQTGIYKMFLTGGPAMAGGDSMAGAYNVAARFGELAIMDTVSVLLWGEITQRIPLMFEEVTDTLVWEFSYTAPYNQPIDTIYSTGLSFILEGLPDTDDYWNFGPKFPVRILPKITPVELTSFRVTDSKGIPQLTWQTASETNNKGFIIERAITTNTPELMWEEIGFVSGRGNSAEKNDYLFADQNPVNSLAYYRLQQIDFDGSTAYSPAIEFTPAKTLDFTITAVYPNPFNPATRVKYTIPVQMNISISLYTAAGEKVMDLFNGYSEPGTHSLGISAGTLSSGVYLLSITGPGYQDAVKLILAK